MSRSLSPYRFAGAPKLLDNLVSAYEFEETGANVAYDAHGSNNGAINGALVNQPSVARGYSFDGVNDYVNVPDSNDLSFTDGSTDLACSISFWLKLSANKLQWILVKRDNGSNDEWQVSYSNSLQTITLALFTNSTNYIFARIPFTYNTNWNHVVFTYDGSEVNTGFKGYLNGDEASMTLGASGSYTGMSNGSSPVRIGARWDLSSSYFLDGNIDQISIWTKELTQAEITQLYNAKNGLKYDYFDTGLKTNLVSLWELDETSGTTATDSHGSNNGTITGATVNQQGIVSNLEKCYYFDGSNDCVDVNDTFDDIIAGADKKFSMSAFINLNNPTTGAAQVIMSKLADSGMGANERQFSFAVNSNGKVYVVAYGTVFANNFRVYESDLILSANTWYHVVISYDGSIDTNDGLNRLKVYIDGVSRTVILSSVQGGLPDIPTSPAHFGIGSAIRSNGTTTGYEFGGKIDQPCIWDKIITSSEVVQIYNSGTGLNYDDWSAALKTDLVSLWKFDERSTNLLCYDSHGLNDGTIVGATVNQPGIIGKSYDFDGINDYVNIGNVTDLNFERTDSFSISVWVYYDGTNGGTIFSKMNGLDIYRGYLISIDASGLLSAILRNSVSTTRLFITSTTSISTSTWTHVVLTYDGSSSTDGMQIYINGSDAGKTVVTDTLNSTIITSADAIMANREALDSYLGARLDNLFIFNKELTSGEVSWLYNNGIGRAYDELK